MNLPKLPRAPFPRRYAVIALTLLVAVNGSVTKAETPPQFAFSIGSNQIAGGISPLAAGVDFGGKLYISSLWHVIKIDTNGALLTQWGTQGTGPGQFSYAGQTAFDPAGHVYVLDSYNDRVEEFDTNGTFIIAWGSAGAGPGQFDQPGGLAVSGAGRIYVSDTLNFRVQVFSSPGVFLKQFGSNGTNTGQFSFPGVIAIDSSNNVYVTDSPGGAYDNYRVQKFDADGKFLLQWAAYGTNTGGSIQVPGMATDPQDNVYIADGSNNRVQKFSSQGVFLSQWGNFGTGPGQFNNPMGVALDPTGNYVYVPDYYNARVNVFAYAARAPLMYQPPTNQIVPAGSTLTLAAGVFGAQPLVYRWQFNESDVTVATDATLVITNVPLSASGSYSVSVSDTLGTAASSTAMISVLPAVVTTLPVGGITATSAMLHGSFWVGNHSTTGWFEWGTNTDYGNVTGVTNLDLNRLSPAPWTLSGLDGELMYHYRAAASNDLGVVYGQDVAFQVGLQPVVVTLPAIPTASGSVVLNATVNPEARDTTAFFQWGKSQLGGYTASNQLPSTVGPVVVQNPLTGLQPGVVYVAQAIASNALGTARGAVVSFIAPPWALLPSPAGIDWLGLSVSADGSNLVAVAPGTKIFRSPDSGRSWTSNAIPNASWQAVTMSADGSNVVVASGGAGAAGPLYFTTNSGKAWIPAHGMNRNWFALASSGDGQRVAAVDFLAQQILLSTNGGLDWRTNSQPPPANWTTIASSGDGQHLMVGAGGGPHPTNGPVYTSTDAGNSWSAAPLPSLAWQSLACSADGQIILAAATLPQGGFIYVSTNGGTSWALSGAPITNWQAVAVSADGTRFAALARVAATPVFISTDFGVTWQRAALPPAVWSAVALSADGAKLFVAGDQYIVTLQTPPAAELTAGSANGELSLSWVIPSAPLALQHTADLSAPQWTNAGLIPAVSFTDVRYHVTLPATERSGFYRLTGAN